MAQWPLLWMAVLVVLAPLGSTAPFGTERAPRLVDPYAEGAGWSLPQANLSLDSSTVPTLLTGNRSQSEQESFNLSKDIAVQFVLGKVLRALGPRFEKDLPTAPTNATLTPLDTALRVETEWCPPRYRRCSSLTFYPSCELPRNTNRHMWNRRFSLFYDISEQLSSIHRADVLNATLRLYKNISIPLTNPMTLIVRLHAFTQSLRLNRERSILVASTRVSNDYNGWVFLNVERVFRKLKGRHNYGFKLSVKNERNEIWNIPNLFVKMDCQASNESLVPLPFEVQLNDTAQRYPALNIRYGSQEIVQDNTDFLPEMDGVIPGAPVSRRVRNRNSPGMEPVINVNSFATTPNYTNVLTTTEVGEYYRGNSRHLDQMLNPHLFSQSDMADQEAAFDDTPNYYAQSHESHIYSDLTYPDSVYSSSGHSQMQNKDLHRSPAGLEAKYSPLRKNSNIAKRHEGGYAPYQADAHSDYSSDYQDDLLAEQQHLTFLNSQKLSGSLEQQKNSSGDSTPSDYVLDRPARERHWRRVHVGPIHGDAATGGAEEALSSPRAGAGSPGAQQQQYSSRLLRRQLRRGRQQVARRHRQLQRRLPAHRSPPTDRWLA